MSWDSFVNDVPGPDKSYGRPAVRTSSTRSRRPAKAGRGEARHARRLAPPAAGPTSASLVVSDSMPPELVGLGVSLSCPFGWSATVTHGVSPVVAQPRRRPSRSHASPVEQLRPWPPLPSWLCGFDPRHPLSVVPGLVRPPAAALRQLRLPVGSLAQAHVATGGRERDRQISSRRGLATGEPRSSLFRGGRSGGSRGSEGRRGRG